MSEATTARKPTQPGQAPDDARCLYVFGAFHYDVAYQKTFSEYLPRSLEIIDAGLDLLGRNAQYIFCIEQVILVAEYWTRRPERQAEFRRFAQEERIIFCPGMWTMPDINMPGAESLYQNALLGRAWLMQHVGVPPGPICWMADVAGHHPQIPQMCSQLGYSLYMFARGQVERDDVVDFAWQGIDGTRVLAHWEPETYYGLTIGLEWHGKRSEEWIRDRIERFVLSPLSRGGSPVMLSTIGGDFCPPHARDAEFVNAWNGAGRSPRIQMAHPDTFIQALRRRTDLPVLKEDLNPLFQGTYASRIRLKQRNRACETLLYACELLDAVRGATAGDDTSGMWRRLCTIQFHDILWGSLAHAAWTEAMTEADALHQELRNAVARRLATDPGEETVVFNPLPYPREDIVETGKGPGLVRLDAMQIARLEDVAMAHVSTPATVAGRRLENGLLCVEIDEYGRIARMRDVPADCLYEDERHGYLHDVTVEPDPGDPWTRGRVNGSLLHVAPCHDPASRSGTVPEPYGPVQTRGADSLCFEHPQVEVGQGSHGVMAWYEATYPARGLTIRYTLHANEKLLRIRVAHRTRIIRARLRAVVPTGIPGGAIRREIPAGYVRQPEGEFPAQSWMDYANEDRGLCLLNRGLPGNNTTDGVMLLSLFRAVVMDEPGVAPDYELEVDQEAVYALHPFTPGDNRYDPCRLGKLFNNPVLGATGRLSAGDSRRMEFHGRAEPLAVRAVAEDCIELRLHESSGSTQDIRITCHAPVRQASLITPLGEPVRDVRLGATNDVHFTLKAFEIATLRLEFMNT